MSGPIDPIQLFLQDRERARAAGEGWDATAGALATVNELGLPSVRFVLVKEAAADGFRFYTNRQSRKADELRAVPHAALAFLWQTIDVQFRIEGKVLLLDDASSDAYFASRPRISQLGAWASEQSRPLASREVLLARLAELEKRFPDGTPVPRPPHWGGYLLVPARIEHWHAAEFRLHQRTLYEREGTDWRPTLMNP
jgi:pyridoxamine 5'-phosphate oxidase